MIWNCWNLIDSTQRLEYQDAKPGNMIFTMSIKILQREY